MDTRLRFMLDAMELTNGIYWKDNSHWLGYFKDYPDYWTQGESLEDLQAHLLDLYRDLSRNDIRSNIFKLF